LASWRDSANRKHSKQFKLRRDAQNHLDAMKTEVKTGVFIPAKTGRTTLDAWWDEWWVTQVQLRGSTEARDAASYKNHVKPTFGDVPLQRIEHHDVATWVATLVASGTGPDVVHKAHQVLSKALRAAVKSHKVRSNVAEGIDLPRIVKPKIRVFTPAEISALALAIDPRYRHFPTVGAYTGLRVGEMFALVWDNVDLVARRVSVEATVVEVHGRLTVNEPKTNAGKRVVPLPQVVIDALRAANPKPARDALVFPNSVGTHTRTNGFRQRIWVPALQAANIEPRPVHCLRHTAISFWLASGATVVEAKQWGGHESVSTILDRYGHLLTSQTAQRMNALDRLATSSHGDAGF
jgi:integrase